MSAESALRAGMRAAADRFARTMRVVAGQRTQETAAAVNVADDGDKKLIRAGHPGGGYGWEPIQALMFDNNKRHPLFGDKRHWYKQGRYPITQYTERAGIEAATEAFADAFVDEFVRDYGFH